MLQMRVEVPTQSLAQTQTRREIWILWSISKKKRALRHQRRSEGIEKREKNLVGTLALVDACFVRQRCNFDPGVYARY